MSIYGAPFPIEKIKSENQILFLIPKSMQPISNKDLSITKPEKNSAIYFIYPLRPIGKIAGTVYSLYSEKFGQP